MEIRTSKKIPKNPQHHFFREVQPKPRTAGFLSNRDPPLGGTECDLGTRLNRKEVKGYNCNQMRQLSFKPQCFPLDPTQHKTTEPRQLTSWPLFFKIKFRYRISTHTGGFNKSIIAFFVRICSSLQNCSCKPQVINKYKIYFTIDTTREQERRRFA